MTVPFSIFSELKCIGLTGQWISYISVNISQQVFFPLL